MRFVSLGGRLDYARILSNFAGNIDLGFVHQSRKINIRRVICGLSGIGHELDRLAEHRGAPRVSILDIEDRVVLGLLDDLRKIEIEGCVVLAEDHHEPDGVASDLVDDLSQSYEFPGPLRHLHGLPAAQELHQLAKLHVEFPLPLCDRSDGGLIVSGAKVVATTSTLTHYNFIANNGALPIKTKPFAFVCIVPNDSPGLKLFCRPSYEWSAGTMGTPFD